MARRRDEALAAPPNYSDYRPLTLDTTAARIADYPGIAELLGGAPGDWDVREVGDGNLNYVYIVNGRSGSVCVKQALPYVRLVGESWPLPLSRSFYEHAALVRQDKANGCVPEIYHFDGPQALIVMENLGRHKIWRKALIARERHESAAATLGAFMAETLFRSSDLALPAHQKNVEMAIFASNTALCKITEDLVFTDPYYNHPMNAWTAPDLDETVKAIWQDAEWKAGAQELKSMFLTRAEALIHGDLHTGSVMVGLTHEGAEDVRVIDPEFAFYGPMGFDVGAVMANLFLSFFAQDGYGDGARIYQDWLTRQMASMQCHFSARFSELWRTERVGDAYPAAVFEDQGDADGAEIALTAYLSKIEEDALGFAGAKMTRRIVGLAKVADLERIEPKRSRALCERRALTLARALIVERGDIRTFEDAIERAEAVLRDVT
ncbi:MAG: S-methyl-5-thioribose kinase [Pseudomonadota bacterium]